MIKIGKKNIIFGWIWLTIIIVLWCFLEYRLEGNSVSADLGEYEKDLIKDGCFYGCAFAVINIFYGMQIDNLDLIKDIKNGGSYLAILGCIISSSTLIISGIGFNITSITSTGIFCIIFSLTIIIFGWLKK